MNKSTAIPHHPFTLIALTTLLPVLATVALLMALRSPAAMAAPDAVITVDTLLDENDGSCSDGDCSLRDAIATAASGDTILFSVEGSILLAGELVVDKNVTINGGHTITVSGNNASRVFKVTSSNVTFDSLTIADGRDQSNDCFNDSCAGGILIVNAGTQSLIVNSRLVHNSGKYGGAVHNSFNSVMVISNSTFIDNAGSFGGGLLNKGTLTINRSAFLNNTAVWDGGGFDNADGATAVVNHSTFSGNTADSGGGIANTDNSVTINNSTITANHASTEGGGVGSYGDNATHTTLANTIVVGNSAGTGTPDDLSLLVEAADSFVSSGYNLIGAVGTGVSAFADGVNGDQVGVTDPLLAPLADNGGATLTHALLPNSPAVDAGDPAYPVLAGDYDQRGAGFDRVSNGRLDIGAYEMQTVVYSLTLNVDGAGTINCDGGCAAAYGAGTVVTLTAVSTTSSTFIGWSGSIITTTNPVTLMMDAPKMITATFNAITYTVFLPVIVK